MHTSVIDEFLEHYSREFDHYNQAAFLVQKRIEGALAKRGILAIVTARAKGIDRLRTKLQKRNEDKQYKNIKAIYKDIIDLSGVRVALYFPGDRENVDALIREVFIEVRESKTFPVKHVPKIGKRFVGYCATHYLIKVKQNESDFAEVRYANTWVEVQVASVLMHAWAEVEHDLEYKPETGTLSEDEISILDEINGLVIAGEIALERLQRAVQRRTAQQDALFKDRFELASFLSQRVNKDGWQTKEVGRVDVLLTALEHLGRATPSNVNRYIDQIGSLERNRPIADVLVDMILTSNRKGSKNLPDVLGKAIWNNPFESSVEESSDQAAIGNFLMEWRQLERLIARVGGFTPRVSILHAIEKIPLEPQIKRDINHVRILRNNLVHGNEMPPASIIKVATELIRDHILPDLRRFGHESGPNPS